MSEPGSQYIDYYLQKARQSLTEARAVLGLNLAESAGRAAYLAAHHAAQALIFHQTGKIAKTHGGVRSEFARLAKLDDRIDPAYPTFLATAYGFKAIADYAVGPDAVVSPEQAEAAIETANRFVASVRQVIANPP